MLILSAEEIRSLAPMHRLVCCLEEAYREDWVVPPRQVAEIPSSVEGGLFLSMAAFDLQGRGAIKLVTLIQENRAKALPTSQGVIVVFSETGTPIALLDGTMVTRLRTGAASGLASKYLSRPDSAHLLVIGTGALAPYMALAHCTVRSIKRVSVWGRRRVNAVSTGESIRTLVPEIVVEVAESLERSVPTADIVCCATRRSTPILEGRWLRPGTFVDLVGSFSPSCRESDDDAVLRSRIFVDTYEGAFTEAGDILDPLARGVITKDKIDGDLFDLVRGRVKGRGLEEEIFLFKSVGTDIEDLACQRQLDLGSGDN
jgi:ornithine cyclodeaminase/alanine dehydrogenase-like protein (mu-crystallin family)